MTDGDPALDEWLAEVAEADRRMDPPARLEAYVMARLRLAGRSDAGRSHRRIAWLAASAAMAAALLGFLELRQSGPEPATPVAPPVPAVVVTENPTVAVPQFSASEPVERAETSPVARKGETRRAPVRRVATPPATPEVFDFVPLMPLGEEELLGGFQIVRVQLSRGPDGPVQADVLLGQDGMARAIRVSTRH